MVQYWSHAETIFSICLSTSTKAEIKKMGRAIRSVKQISNYWSLCSTATHPGGAQAHTRNLSCWAKAGELFERTVCLYIPPLLPNGRKWGGVNDLSDTNQLFLKKERGGSSFLYMWQMNSHFKFLITSSHTCKHTQINTRVKTWKKTKLAENLQKIKMFRTYVFF